ncbi:hypothetical protein [Pseudomonas aeruginosa]|uniref:hypothetical protein n=1 Tax=Pseudomonas aeruginosa TaxID=287 RepID=UPI0013CE1F4C|nr:hypothetical protein [Pseudomonas aeruginosa]HBO2745117.1 hypothetical protein [Pseudomonas aeruginosa]
MASKKIYSCEGLEPPKKHLLRTNSSKENTAHIELNLPNGQVKVLDFKKFLGQGFDENISTMLKAACHLRDAGAISIEGIRTSINSLDYWFKFCKSQCSERSDFSSENIDRNLIIQFISWLKNQVNKDGELHSPNYLRTIYTKVKSILIVLCELKIISEANEVFPNNPFPGATSQDNRRKVIASLSDGERERILRPLAAEIGAILNDSHPLSIMDQIGLCAFSIFLKHGLNPAPLFRMERDLSKSLHEHPQKNKFILVTYKARSKKHQTEPIPIPDQTEAAVIKIDTLRILEKVLKITTNIAKTALNPHTKEKLWIYDSPKNGAIIMTPEQLSPVSNRFSKRHNLIRDDGSKLKMSSQLFRNTKHNKIWIISDGDIYATAHATSNTPRVARSYLQLQPQQLEQHRLAGEVLTEILSNTSFTETPVAKCRDNVNGDLAPKNGKICTDFLSCFRCKSQVITKDDLHKLFSFYWAIYSLQSEIGTKLWEKKYYWIIRVIDRYVASEFSEDLISRAKRLARETPHPMWASKSNRIAITSIYE